MSDPIYPLCLTPFIPHSTRAALFRRQQGIHRRAAQDDRETEEILGAEALLQRAPAPRDAHETVQYRHETAAADRRKQVDPEPQTGGQGRRRSLHGQAIGSALGVETHRRAVTAPGWIERRFRLESRYSVHFDYLLQPKKTK